MPDLFIGAQAASTNKAQRAHSRLFGVLSLAIALAMLAVAAAPFATASSPVAASGAKPKAVLIVGPTGDMTENYLAKARQIADQAERAGMDVRRVFHPRATPERVLANIQGAKFVLYLGHGNGWPSPYKPFQERTKNGFGLNPYDGGSANKHVYRGANWIRSNIKLAEHAVVLLVGACYASGNAEPDMPIPSEEVARQRVDNYAAGFLHAGASVVFGHGWQPKANFPQMLMTSDKTFDEMFMVPTWNRSPYGFVGWRDKYFNSQRTPGARMHLDPHQSHGYYRAATGWLNVTAAQWRNGAAATAPPSADKTPPSAPKDFAAQAGSGLEVKLSWKPSTDDSGGSITYRIASGGRNVGTTTGTSFTHQPSSAGTYRYKARAVDAAGNLGEFTPEISVTVGSTSASEAGPSAPTGLAAETLNWRKVRLTWNASTSPVSGTIKYRVIRNGRRIATVTSLEYTDRPWKAGTFEYKVRAVDAAGNVSDFSPTVDGRAVKGRV